MEFDIKQLAGAMRMIAEEKNLEEDIVQDIVESALSAAYKRDYGDREMDVRVQVNMNDGGVSVYEVMTVVEEVENDHAQISLEDAKKKKKDAKLDDKIEKYVEVTKFGRVAAQTAKQVIMQRLREAEREVVMAEYEEKIGEIINAVVTRIESRMVRLEVGKAQAIMPASEQSRSERYFPGQRIKVYLRDIEKSFRGPQLVVSRASTELVRALFVAEVPEMDTGAVEIKAIAREAGVRTKLAVNSTVQGVDPVGTFVGGHGTRVNAIVNEIGDQEKIDIVVWDETPEVFIASALSPTKVSSVKLNSDKTRAQVIVPEDQLSIAIGKGGQNVRLASKLTGIEIDIDPEQGSASRDDKATDNETKPVEAPNNTQSKKNNDKQTVDDTPKPKLKRKSEMESSLLEAIDEHGE